MKIGITGQNGFIGSRVTQNLLRENHHIASLDKYTRPDNFNLPKTDVRYDDDLDWVLHFGATTSISSSFGAPFFTYLNNLSSTLKALQIAHNGNAAFLYMSSYVYGKPEYLPIDEKHPVASLNPYMGSKIIGERACVQLSDMLNIPLIILRAFNIYGDCKKPGRLISDMLESAACKKTIVLNDPAPQRDYLYIKDFQRLIAKIIAQTDIKTGIYNVGYGKSYSNLEVAEMVRKLSGYNFKIVMGSGRRRNDVSDCVANVDLIKKKFDWKPIYPLDKGLKELLKTDNIFLL
jgi:nucleoside-diphosphate-sugar epimerase